MARQKLAIFLVALFCAMSYSPMVDASPPKQVDVEIGLGPEGMSDKFIVEVPDGEIVTEFDIEVIEKPWRCNAYRHLVFFGLRVGEHVIVHLK